MGFVLRYNTVMGANKDNLGYLLSATLYSTGKRACPAPGHRSTLDGALLGVLRKSAQEVVTSRVLKNGYTSGAESARQQREQAAQQARERQMAGFTGNKAYDDLPDVRRARMKDRFERAYARHAANNPGIVQRQNYEDAMKQVDADGVTRWADTGLGKFVGAVASKVNKALDPLSGTITYFTSAPKGTSYGDWMKSYTSIKDNGDFGHDFVNNMQIQYNSAKKGLKDLGYTAMEYADPRSYGDSARARDLKTSYRNAKANSGDYNTEVNRRLVEGFRNDDLKNTSSGLGAINYGLNAAFGEVAGQTLGTAGLGNAAKGVGAGIQHGTRALSGAIRGGSAASTAASTAGTAASAAQQTASLGARALNWTRNAAANGVDAIGDTISYVPRTLGQLSNPADAANRAVTGVAKGTWETAKAGFKPVADMWRVANNPSIIGNAYRTAGPWRFAGQAAAYPFKTGWNIAKPTLKPAFRYAFSKPGFEAQANLAAMGSMANGDYGDAAGELGAMGFYGAAGPVALPAMLAYYMYNGANGSGDGGDYGEG